MSCILIFYFKHMKTINTILGLVVFGMLQTQGQEVHVKRDSTKSIEAIEITAQAKRKIETDLKMAVSVDEFLASSDNISFIKRGAYAWEPLLNNMGMEREHVWCYCGRKY